MRSGREPWPGSQEMCCVVGPLADIERTSAAGNPQGTFIMMIVTQMLHFYLFTLLKAFSHLLPQNHRILRVGKNFKNYPV